MTLRKDNAIKDILSDFESFANLVLHQLDLLETLVSEDETDDMNKIIREMMENENKLDHQEVKISDKIVDTIVLQKPVASDIRKIMACYRIVINLERVGDQVVNIVDAVKKVKSSEIYINLNDVVSNMLMQSSNMVNKALLAYTKDDKDYAVWTIKNDALVDEINHKLLKKAIKKSNVPKEEKELITNIISLKSMVSNIERIGDYATNIAEAAIYSIEGKDIRHKKEI